MRGGRRKSGQTVQTAVRQFRPPTTPTPLFPSFPPPPSLYASHSLSPPFHPLLPQTAVQVWGGGGMEGEKGGVGNEGGKRRGSESDTKRKWGKRHKKAKRSARFISPQKTAVVHVQIDF